MTTITKPDYTVTYDDSQEAKDRIFQIALAWFNKVEMYSGESLGQSDTTYVEAPDLLAELAEEGFRFGHKWNDDL